MSGCVTIYENTDYGGRYAKKCVNDVQSNCGGSSDNLGRCSIMPCAAGSSPCWGFGDETSSLKVDADVVFNAYKDINFGGTLMQFTGNTSKMPSGWNDVISSWELKKNCDHNNWLWDEGCYYGKSNTINSNMQKMIDRRDNYCNSAPVSDANCINWVTSRPTDKCLSFNKRYCSDKNNIENSYCKGWCNSSTNKPVCDDIASKYCAANINNNTFCGCFEENAINALTDKEKKILYPNGYTANNNNKAICWSNSCANNGYKTSSQLNAINGCPSCYQVMQNNTINIEDNLGSNIKASFTQSCTVDKDNASTSSNTPTSSNTNTQTSETPINTTVDNSIVDNTSSKNIVTNIVDTIFPNVFPYTLNVGNSSYSIDQATIFILLVIFIFLVFSFSSKDTKNDDIYNYQPIYNY